MYDSLYFYTYRGNNYTIAFWENATILGQISTDDEESRNGVKVLWNRSRDTSYENPDYRRV